MRVIHVIVIFVAGCATQYQPVGLTGGYSEIPLNNRMYDVRFDGNGYTAPEAVRQGALRRACELTVLANESHFVIVQEDASQEVTEIVVDTVTKPAYAVRIRILTASEIGREPAAVDAPACLRQLGVALPAGYTPSPVAGAGSAASPDPLEAKRAAFIACRPAVTHVQFRTAPASVRVPDSVRASPLAIFPYGPYYTPDLKIHDAGLRATFTFSTGQATTFVPWAHVASIRCDGRMFNFAGP